MKREASMSVLFVDDEPMLLRSIAHLLEQAPLEVLTAASGADALRIFEERPVDVLVADFDVPRMSGLAWLASVRQQ